MVEYKLAEIPLAKLAMGPAWKKNQKVVSYKFWLKNSILELCLKGALPCPYSHIHTQTAYILSCFSR